LGSEIVDDIAVSDTSGRIRSTTIGLWER